MGREHSIDSAAAVLRRVSSVEDQCDPQLPFDTVLREPTRYLGPFDKLPAELRDSLRKLHRADEEVRTLAAGTTSAALAGVAAVLSRPVFRVNQWVGTLAVSLGPTGEARLAPVRRTLRTIGRQPIKWTYNGRRALHRMACRLRHALGANDLGTILETRRFDVGELGHDYLCGLDYVRGCEAVFQDAVRNTLYTLLLGVDFIQSDGQYWFLEINWNPTLVDERMDLYEGEDPFMEGVLSFVQASGYRRMMVYGHRPFPVIHGRVLQAEGRRRGIAVEVVDDYFSARSDGHRRSLLMEPARLADTFVLRARGFDSVSDRAILSKQRSLEVMRQHNATTGVKDTVLLPKRVPFGAAASSYQADSRWPNIVGKIDMWDRGVGVFFYKTPSVPLDLKTKLDYVEEYKVPDPVAYRLCRGKREPIQGGHRASKLRCFVLISPFATTYLSSIRVVSGLEVPPTLSDGLVQRKQIYLATVNEGGFYSAVDGQDDVLCRTMASRVGEVVRHWLVDKYVSSDTETPPGMAAASAWR